jgi:hypothetical protein
VSTFTSRSPSLVLGFTASTFASVTTGDVGEGGSCGADPAKK